MPNQFTKAKELGLPKPEMSEATRRKLSIATANWNNARFQNVEVRQKLSESMKRAVAKFPDSYGVSNRGRTRKISAYGQTFQGEWELDFFEYCMTCLIEVERVKLGFKYEWNGNRTYFPDFYLPAFDLYVEIKGYETERDLAKWKYFPYKLKIVRRKEIELMRKAAFDLVAFMTE